MAVDLDNIEVRDYIARASALPHADMLSPYKSIPVAQYDLYHWSKMYEELEPVVSDHIYDMHVRYLQRTEIMFPDIWKEVSLQCFKDGSWQYTGLFIEDHDPEDEEWIL